MPTLLPAALPSCVQQEVLHETADATGFKAAASSSSSSCTVTAIAASEMSASASVTTSTTAYTTSSSRGIPMAMEVSNAIPIPRHARGAMVHSSASMSSSSSVSRLQCPSMGVLGTSSSSSSSSACDVVLSLSHCRVGSPRLAGGIGARQGSSENDGTEATEPYPDCHSEIAEDDEDELRYDHLHCTDDEACPHDDDDVEDMPAIPPPAELSPKCACLVPKPEWGDDRLCVVLDLDETLVSNRSQLAWCADNEVVQRPHLQTFLSSLSGFCEVILWTASTSEVASAVIDTIDPFHQLFDHVVTRSPAWFKGVPYTKDLRLLGRPLERTIIVENNVDCVSNNRQNAVIVSDFYGTPDQKNDMALLVVLELLEELNESLRPVHEVVTTSNLLSRRPVQRDSSVYEVSANSKPRRLSPY